MFSMEREVMVPSSMVRTSASRLTSNTGAMRPFQTVKAAFIGFAPSPSQQQKACRKHGAAYLLHGELAALREENHRLGEESQALRDEVARLKGQKGKPSIGPSRLHPRKRRRRRGRRRRGGGGLLRIVGRRW